MIEIALIGWVAFSTLFAFLIAARFVAIEERLDAIEKANEKLATLSRAVDRSLCDHLRDHVARGRDL